MSTIAKVLEIATVTHLESLALPERFEEAWNDLAGNIPFRRLEWCRAWWKHYAEPGNRLTVLFVHDERGELIGVAPWYLESTWRKGRVIRFLGSGEICSDYLTILTAPGCENVVARSLAAWLHGEGAGSWDLLQFEAIQQDDECCGLFMEAMRNLGHAMTLKRSANAWRTTLPATWSEFQSTFSKSPRRKFRQLQGQFDAGRARRRRVETAAELNEGLQVLEDLHQKRRTSLGETGCFASRRFAAFHAEIAATLLEHGRLQLDWVELDGIPVAVSYGFVGGDTMYLYQSGFDPAAANESPGTLQLMAAVQTAIENGRRYFDLLRGDEPYKASWKAEPTPLVDVRIAARHRQAVVRHSAWLAARGARNLVRRGLRRIARNAPRSLQVDDAATN